MIVAIYIQSESCDKYLELFVNETVHEIKEKLYDNMEMYKPVCEYDVVFDASTTEKEKLDVGEMLSEWYDDSWNRDDDEEDY
ncbi:hypothetical protein FDG95_gp095 [Pectobacterium phage vB_PcaM_CBB]|uniref:Uncharacterized protein n=1 Tax=Pectobacterium phage vB_PcaM_CBB TaxID=2772511 RepID=A0A1L2CUF8_9CAUD|nr:hypothetical protein FDG95_gp095 [Pectobacterium phage vB_PcaM_CBB]AMM43660.1 hypothetical protein CBB_95 [Pectobacterium phage vB_PcaM_CBB]